MQAPRAAPLWAAAAAAPPRMEEAQQFGLVTAKEGIDLLEIQEMNTIPAAAADEKMVQAIQSFSSEENTNRTPVHTLQYLAKCVEAAPPDTPTQ